MALLKLILVVTLISTVSANVDVEAECRMCTSRSKVYLLYMPTNSAIVQSACVNDTAEFPTSDKLILDARCTQDECVDLIPNRFQTVFRKTVFCKEGLQRPKPFVNIFGDWLEILLLTLLLSIIVIKKSLLQKCVFERNSPVNSEIV